MVSLVDTVGFARHLSAAGREALRNEIALWRLENRLEHPQIARPLSVVSPDRLHIGRNILISRNCHFHCGAMEWSGGRGFITIGDDCWFAGNNVLYGAGGITIGDRTGIGPGVMIFSSREDYSLEFAKTPGERAHLLGPVVIGSYVLIFAGVIVGPNVTIGEGAVVGAGSVVLKDVPAWSMAAGVPARILGERRSDSQAESMVRVG